MRLLAAHGVRPDRDLGQHFLLDENLVDVSLREGAVGPDDVVLEVGAGVGVLTAALARRARAVHAVEVDRRLAGALGDALAGLGNVRLHWADAMRLALEELDPPPTRLVANLPYDVATPVLLESLVRLPRVERWCLMVQREVADRWLAGPGTRAYGAPSVLVALTAAPTFRRAVGREVFTPRPRVDSALLALRRTAPGPSPAVRDLVRTAFAQRRKTLANALAAGAGRAGRPGKERVLAVLRALGLPPAARAADLPPAAFPRLAEELAWTP
jgi:16S rRNA (adenine1518-N6/adenine1519-N6)-dimethyltransferase